MDRRSLILSLDVGTQSSRAILFDLSGNIVAKHQIHIEPYISERPGWAEQDPAVYWDAICQACQALWADNDIDQSLIKGLGLTTQRATLINLDAEGRVLRPAMIWLDQRRAENPPRLSLFWRAAFKLAGVSDLINSLQVEAECNWIAENQPDIWEQTAHFLLLSGYLNWRLTDEFVDSVGAQVGYIPFDYKKRDWAAPADFKWQALAVRRDQLPDLRKPGEQLGTLSAQAAAGLGLPEGLPVIATAADKACEVVGAGCVEPHQACLSFGTTATINTTTKKYVEVNKFLPPYPGGIRDCYATEVQIYRGFWMVSWFKKQFADREQRMAAEQGTSPERLLDDLVKDVPPGSMGLMLQPYWSPGVREPGPEAKGAIIGFGDVHTRAHVYRAILEGLAYALRDGREKTEQRSGTKITTLRIAGGGSQSDAAMQLTADIFNLPAERAHIYETSALGAAINVAVGLELYEDYEQAVERMCHVGDIFEPDPESVRLYDQLYEQVYQRMYRQLKPLYEDIRRITGYPE